MNEMNLATFKLSTHFKTHFRRVFSENKTFKAQLRANEFYHVMIRTASENMTKYFNEEMTQVYTENYLANKKGELFRVYYVNVYKVQGDARSEQIIEKGIEPISYETALEDYSLFPKDREKLEKFYEISTILSLQSRLEDTLANTAVLTRKRKI